LLEPLPDTPERAQQELTLQITLGAPLIATKGFAAPEVHAVYSRALDLCHQRGETPQLFSVLWGMAAFYSVRSEWRTVQESAEQLLNLAHNFQDTGLLIEAHYAMGQVLHNMGNFLQSRFHLEQIDALYTPVQHHALAFSYGIDPGVMGRSVLAAVLLYLGYPDQARQMGQKALVLAEEVDHASSLAFGLAGAGWLSYHGGDMQTMQSQAEALITLTTEQGFALWLAWGKILRGWAIAEQGNRKDGLAQMREGLSAYLATGATGYYPYFLVLLAEAYMKMEQTAEGLAAVAEALQRVTSTEERMYEAEIYRLKGELLLQQTPDNHSAAEPCFYQALDVARQQEAKSLELRAAISLARLWQEQGKTTEAHRMLSKVYNWFTEGFETKDLQEARALLEELT
jgi:predicted ATPase